jgi:hypothetical protein
MAKKKSKRNTKKPEDNKPDLISRYPSYLRRGVPNSQLLREEGFRGNTYGPAGPVQVYTKEQREEYERQMRERGDLEMTRRVESVDAPHAQFQVHVLVRLREAEVLTGDSFGGVCNLIVDLGAVEVAKMLVDAQELMLPPSGFIRLLKHKLACLTIEQAIVDFADSGLFTDEEVETAKVRLATFRKR